MHMGNPSFFFIKLPSRQSTLYHILFLLYDILQSWLLLCPSSHLHPFQPFSPIIMSISDFSIFSFHFPWILISPPSLYFRDPSSHLILSFPLLSPPIFSPLIFSLSPHSPFSIAQLSPLLFPGTSFYLIPYSNHPLHPQLSSLPFFPNTSYTLPPSPLSLLP